MNSLLRIPYAAAWAAARGLAAHVSPGESKLRRVFAGRAGLLERFEAWGAHARDKTRKLLWVHAPSVGEGLQALPVLQLVRARRPDVQIAYTFYSPSAEQFAKTLPADFADYLPFDTAGDSRRALAALVPAALVYSKLDLWPVLTEHASRSGAKLGLVSATLPLDSRRSGTFGRALLRDAYALIDAVGAITTADAERFERLGIPAERISVTGDTRYDQVWERARRSLELPTVTALGSDRPTLVAGSTWPSDESRLLPAWSSVLKQLPRARLIIAPHELEETQLHDLISRARANGWSAARIGDALADTDVIVVDRMGILGDLYALADCAYVGGGFHGAGLHSVLEPAAFGVPVLFGPRNSKSADAAALAAAGGGFEVRDSASLEQNLLRFLDSGDARDPAGARALELVRSGLGASERSFELVSSLLDGR